jgi:O-antigen ligase
LKKNAEILFAYLPVLLAFLMPFPSSDVNVLSGIILLWLVMAIFNFDKSTFLLGLKNKWFWILFSFVFFTCISALSSNNKHDALTSIEVKLSFLAFPVYIFLFNYKTDTIKRIFAAFVSGCLFALLACLVRATYLYMETGQSMWFFYTDFSYFMHAGYFSMYMLFALLIVQLAYPIWFPNDGMYKWLRIIFTLFFVLGIFLCASKIGIIAFFVTILILPLVYFKDKLNLKSTALLILVIGALTFVTYKVIPTPFERLQSAFTTAAEGNIDKTSTESTAVRMLIWKESAQILKDNFLWGVGTGDANDELHKRYEAAGLTGALAHNLNTHNQFFQTGIGMGLLGLIILGLCTLGALIYSIMKRNLMLTIFSIIIILNFLVESMLQTQAGTIFFVYFLCLLLKYNPQRLDI